VIWGKRRITIPMRAFEDAGLELGERLRVRADGPGRIVLERIDAAHLPLAALEAG
jgi:bifunctional DNA-binding transcriptional regulator/antitoxin component of YhaV-PrlF toxin-antitoxin module